MDNINVHTTTEGVKNKAFGALAISEIQKVSAKIDNVGTICKDDVLALESMLGGDLKLPIGLFTNVETTAGIKELKNRLAEFSDDIALEALALDYGINAYIKDLQNLSFSCAQLLTNVKKSSKDLTLNTPLLDNLKAGAIFMDYNDENKLMSNLDLNLFSFFTGEQDVYYSVSKDNHNADKLDELFMKIKIDFNNGATITPLVHMLVTDSLHLSPLGMFNVEDITLRSILDTVVLPNTLETNLIKLKAEITNTLTSAIVNSSHAAPNKALVEAGNRLMSDNVSLNIIEFVTLLITK